jgi:hypothetical protein
MELIRLTPELLEEVGFKKTSYISEETNQEYSHYELPLTRRSDYGDFLLISNASDEVDFPIVQIFGVDEYEFHHLEPLVLLMNLLQSVCVVEDFKLDEQFKDKQGDENN